MSFINALPLGKEGGVISIVTPIVTIRKDTILFKWCSYSGWTKCTSRGTAECPAGEVDVPRDGCQDTIFLKWCLDDGGQTGTDGDRRRHVEGHHLNKMVSLPFAPALRRSGKFVGVELCRLGWRGVTVTPVTPVS